MDTLDDYAAQSRVLATLATTTWGVVDTSELLEAGFTHRQVQGLARNGRLHRVRRGVYVVGHRALGREAILMAGVRCAGPGAVVSHASALAAWQAIPERSVRGAAVHVSVPKRRRRIEGVVIHETSRVSAEECTTWRGIPIVTIERAILQFAETAPAASVVAAIREGAFHHVLDIDRLEWMSIDEAGMPGSRTLRDALDLRATGSRGARSRAELDAIRFLGTLPIPRPLLNVVMPCGDRTFELDLSWPDHGVNVEIDGPGHERADVAREDEARDALLRSEGWTVHRVTTAELERDPHGAFAPIVDVIHHRHPYGMYR